jgi:hypothetical protein
MKLPSITLTIVFASTLICAKSQINQDVLFQAGHVPIILNDTFTHSHIAVQKGEKIEIEANGIMNWYTGSCNGKCTSTPSGIPCPGPSDKIVAPQLSCLSLIAKIGEKGQWFEVGEHYVGVATESGELIFAVNDEYFADNTGSWAADVSMIDPCLFPEKPQVGDVIIYWGDNGIVHSGYIVELDSNNPCVVKKITSFLQKVINNNQKLIYDKIFTCDPDNINLTDARMFGKNWTIYHTDRKMGRFIDVYTAIGAVKIPAIPGFMNGYTDKGTIIYFPYNSYLTNSNCHGFTFSSTHHSISGYQTHGGKLHDQESVNDQGMAVEYILAENGYHQIHAMGVNSRFDHFKIQYEVNNFKLRE